MSVGCIVIVVALAAAAIVQVCSWLNTAPLLTFRQLCVATNQSSPSLPGRAIEIQYDGLNRMLLAACSPPNTSTQQCPYPPRFRYLYPEESGEDVTIYLADTGADPNHDVSTELA